MRTAALVTMVLAFAAGSANATTKWPTGQKLRALVYKTDPCLARIIDRENPPWDTRLYNGFTRWTGGPMRNRSYGLPQAQPPEKMAKYGRQWRTSPWTQLNFMRAYTKERYGGSCAALDFWLRHNWY